MKNYQDSAKPLIGIIANSTSPANRLELAAELGEPQNGFFGPLKFSYQDFRGEIIPLDIQPNEILEKSGMIKGRQAMLRAVEYLASQGAKVICFTASTKRLPGKMGQEVKRLYPDITFSIGDNLTNVSYLSLIDHFLSLPDKIDKQNDEFVVMGAGFLGLQTIESLLAHDCRHLTLISEQRLPDNLIGKVNLVNLLEKTPFGVKMFMSCSHKYYLDPTSFLSHLDKEAVILDVAVPPGISREVYRALPPTIARLDAGDFFLDDVKYSFPPSILSFPIVGFWYGCFTEAIILSLALEAGENLEQFNFFEINPAAQKMLRGYLGKERVSLPLVNFYQPAQVAFVKL